MHVGRRDRMPGAYGGRNRARFLATLLASLVALTLLPAADALAADRSGTVTDTTPFGWAGPAASGSNTTYDAATGEPCPPAPPRVPADQCDVTLLQVNAAAFGGVDISIAPNDLVAGPD